jgi:S-adenosylmethionine:tRNA-ribosyltransferase-isomerase (queuine synthetase)
VPGYAGETRLFIPPGYRFRAIDLLPANFHLLRWTGSCWSPPWPASIA